MSTTARIGLAVAALGVGVLVYVFDRDPASAYLMPSYWSAFEGGTSRFGALHGQLPAALHVFAFSLLTSAVLGRARAAALVSCVGWWAIDSAFELAQHPKWVPWLAEYVPSFDGIPGLENTAAYLRSGTFDGADLLAIAFGAMAAYLTMRRLDVTAHPRRAPGHSAAFACTPKELEGGVR